MVSVAVAAAAAAAAGAAGFAGKGGREGVVPLASCWCPRQPPKENRKIIKII